MCQAHGLPALLLLLSLWCDGRSRTSVPVESARSPPCAPSNHVDSRGSGMLAPVASVLCLCPPPLGLGEFGEGS